MGFQYKTGTAEGASVGHVCPLSFDEVYGAWIVFVDFMR